MENEEIKKVKMKISFIESVKFGVGLGAGLFLWMLILSLVGILFLERLFSGMMPLF